MKLQNCKLIHALSLKGQTETWWSLDSAKHKVSLKLEDGFITISNPAGDSVVTPLSNCISFEIAVVKEEKKKNVS